MIKNYIKYKFLSIITYIVYLGIFILIGTLYGIKKDGISYAIVLCFFFATIFFIIGYYNYKKHIQILKLFENNVDLNLDNMPCPINSLEEEYQTILSIFTEKNRILISNEDKNYSDMLDYYTMWAHQIKTPISALGLILHDLECEEKRSLEMELFKIDDYVEMVLQYLRCSSEKTDYVIKKVQVDVIVKESLKKVASLFINKKIKLQYEPLNMKCITDEKWLSFVLVQILTNAIKYTDSGGIIKIYQDERCPGTLVIEDNGIGISKEDLPRICEKGFTGYNGRIYKKSTGIGLYLCKRILDKLCHGIQIESSIGIGTKVKLLLEEKYLVCE